MVRLELAYILRHAWLWPLVFWMRPLEVIQRINNNGRKWTELICAILGGGVWGATVGVILWFWMDNFHIIWILAIIGAFALAITFVRDITGIIDAIFLSSVVIAVIVIHLVIVTGVVVVSDNAITWINARINLIKTIAIIVIIFFGVGSYIGKVNWGLAVVFVMSFLAVSGTLRFIIELVELIEFISISGIAVSFFLGLITVTRFYNDTDDEVRRTNNKKNLRKNIANQKNWLVLFWGLFPTLGLYIWLFFPEAPALNNPSKTLVWFLILIAPVLTGFFLYPLSALLSIIQCREKRVQVHTAEDFSRFIPFRWQTFAYPLPGLGNYLIKVAHYHDMEAAFTSIQRLQLRTLQMNTARWAASKLAEESNTALSFCGEVAIRSNAATLASLSLTGAAARSVAVMARKLEQEDRQPLQLYVGVFPPKKIRPILARFFPSLKQDWFDLFESEREKDLPARLAYAIKELDACTSFMHTDAFLNFLKTLKAYVDVANLNDFIKLPQENLSHDKHMDAKWMAGGWRILRLTHTIVNDIDIYRELPNTDSRQKFLAKKTERLQSLNWQDLPPYWALIAGELVEHWADILQIEAKQAKEWLKLECVLPKQSFKTGEEQYVALKISNPTGVLARNIVVQVEESPGIAWPISEIKLRFLAGGQDNKLDLKMKCEKSGKYLFKGRLSAVDMDETPYTLPLAFPIQVDEPGRAYHPPDIFPYVTGESLGDDRTFVGRGELLRWLRGLWRQPQGKPAVVLTGQRRIGKSSLLHKIRREDWTEVSLLPVFINIQGCNSEYDFLSEAADKMAKAAGAPMPELGHKEPYADFKRFLSGLKSVLGTKRFLLMLDEADLIPQRHLGDLLPGFLRALMQEPEYPTLLLFCGTHALKRMGREYDSILFNTAQIRTVSYMNKQESAEVLEKPAREILEFHPIVLEEAYRLTRGQPFLLQMLGAALIRQCNAAFFAGEERNNYVDLNDLEQAASMLVEQESNMAFETHWSDSNVATRRVLSALAWATDETNRKQLDIDGIETAMRENRLELPRNTAFRILEQLAEEEILVCEGPTYRFAVPLYRRWVDWRWGPMKVKQEALEF